MVAGDLRGRRIESPTGDATRPTTDKVREAVFNALGSLDLIDGARVLGIDDHTGSLEVGKRADVAVVAIDHAHAEPGGDAVSRVVYSATAADVRHVLVDGEVVVQHGEHRRLDGERVLADARAEAKKLVARARI